MMSGRGANPTFFHKKKIKIGRPEHSLTPTLPTSDNISILSILSFVNFVNISLIP